MATLARGEPAAALPGPPADIALAAMTHWPYTVYAGDALGFDLIVNNRGPFVASNVLLRMEVPAGTTFLSFADAPQNPVHSTAQTPTVGGTGTVLVCIPIFVVQGTPGGFGYLAFKLRVVIDPSASPGSTVTGTATVASSRSVEELVFCPGANVDPIPENDSISATATVTGPADISLAMTASSETVYPGDAIGFRIAVDNRGPSDASNVALRMDIPAGTTFLSYRDASALQGNSAARLPAVGATGSAFVCIANARVSATAVDSLIFDITVVVDASAPAGSTISGTAKSLTNIERPMFERGWCLADNRDPVAENDSATANVTVGSQPSP